MFPVIQLAQEMSVPVIPIFVESDNTPDTILDLSATLGVDILILGLTHRNAIVHLMKGDVVRQIARNLPENIQLVIHG
jgi:nucleotide-binding universal stress UspA family protein